MNRNTRPRPGGGLPLLLELRAVSLLAAAVGGVTGAAEALGGDTPIDHASAVVISIARITGRARRAARGNRCVDLS